MSARGDAGVSGDREDTARTTYDAFAPAYDDFTHAYMNERWTGRLLAKAEKHGLEGTACSMWPVEPARASSRCSTAAGR